MPYHRFISDAGEFYGSFEIFYITTDPFLSPGYYWQPCFPGCLPDADEPCGPFADYEQALSDARGDYSAHTVDTYGEMTNG